MTEIIIPEKLTETIVNIIKNGNVFAKMKRIECLVYGSAILVTIFGSSIMMNTLLNTRLLLDNNTERDNSQLLISKQNDTLQKLHYKVDKVIEFNKQLMILFAKNESEKNLPQMNDDSTIYAKSCVTSLSSLTYEQSMVDEEECVEQSMVEQSMVEQSMIDEERAEKH